MECEQCFEKTPNEEVMRFYQQLEEVNCSLCVVSPHFALSIVVRLINIKSDWSISQAVMDSWSFGGTS